MMKTDVRRAAGVLLVPLLAACGERETAEEAGLLPGPPLAAETGPQAEFWAALQQLCNNAYEGTVVAAPAGDAALAGHPLVMHVRHCDRANVRIAVHMGEDRSRTWVISRTEHGLRLKHDHRREDGTDAQITLYGGDTQDTGTAHMQQFPADTFTATLIPEARADVWTVEVQPGERFIYALQRIGTDRRFHLEFDLARPVAAPPPPWGAH
jgi:hypothetical protein